MGAGIARHRKPAQSRDYSHVILPCVASITCHKCCGIYALVKAVLGLRRGGGGSGPVRMGAHGTPGIAWNRHQFLQAYVSNVSWIHVHGITACSHRSAWNRCLSLSMHVEPQSSFIEVPGSAWKRVDAHPTSHNRSKCCIFFRPAYDYLKSTTPLGDYPYGHNIFFFFFNLYFYSGS